jgi:hypothetical protein
MKMMESEYLLLKSRSFSKKAIAQEAAQEAAQDMACT